FSQAEDGIRYRNVTGVQTCALPISLIIISGEIDVSVGPMVAFVSVCLAFLLQFEVPLAIACLLVLLLGALMGTLAGVLRGVFNRSEERRVGEGGWAGGGGGAWC